MKSDVAMISPSRDSRGSLSARVNRRCGNQQIQSGSLASGIHCVDWAGPQETEAIGCVPIFVPDVLGIDQKKCLEPIIARSAIEDRKVAHQDSLELRSICPRLRLRWV